MISFIIIGRNEGWKLTKCLQSVKDTIEYNKLYDAELLYVDSKSVDDSLNRAKHFEGVKIFSITGACNAAIARNIGARESKGDILFFIDGDMEIQKDFLLYAIKNNKLKYDCVSGHVDDYIYDVNDNFSKTKPRTYSNQIPSLEQVLESNGGIFLIKKEIWDKVGGMKTKYKINEDNEFSYSLSKIGVKVVRLPHLICKHHTVEYANNKRMWTFFSNRKYPYSAMFIRNYLFSIFALKRLVRIHNTELLFILTCLSLLLGDTIFKLFIFIYILALLLRSYKFTANTVVRSNKILYFFERILYQFIRDVVFWFSFLFIYPKEIEIEYTKLSD